MGLVQLICGLIAIAAQAVELIGNFTHGEWVVLVNPIAEGITIIVVAIMGYLGFKTSRELKILKAV